MRLSDMRCDMSDMLWYETKLCGKPDSLPKNKTRMSQLLGCEACMSFFLTSLLTNYFK